MSGLAARPSTPHVPQSCSVPSGVSRYRYGPALPEDGASCSSHHPQPFRYSLHSVSVTVRRARVSSSSSAWSRLCWRRCLTTNRVMASFSSTPACSANMTRYRKLILLWSDSSVSSLDARIAASYRSHRACASSSGGRGSCLDITHEPRCRQPRVHRASSSHWLPPCGAGMPRSSPRSASWLAPPPTDPPTVLLPTACWSACRAWLLLPESLRADRLGLMAPLWQSCCAE
eukprot:scaffold15525_cov112-Isochrysis_galbana.AAC.1